MIALKIIAAVIVADIFIILFIYGACHKETPKQEDDGEEDDGEDL